MRKKRKGSVRKKRKVKKAYKVLRRTKNNRYKNWRFSVYKRDNFTCQRCGSKDKLNAHHIRPWSLFANDRFRVTNGITLCITCHDWVHDQEGDKGKYLDLGDYGGN